MTATVRPAVSALPAAVVGWRMFVPAVLLNALVQALLVIGDPVPSGSWRFTLAVIASAAALVLMVWCVTVTAVAAVDGHPRTSVSACLRRPLVAVWTVATGAVAVAISLLLLWATPIVLVLGAVVLVAAAAGARNPVGAGLSVFRHEPLRALLLLVGSLVVAALSWAGALLAGFFITGPLSAVATWILFGVLAVLLQCGWSAVYRRFRPREIDS